MATLKDHQQAMVDLLASGSGIPASASRLAHAMHDVLETMLTGVPSAFSKIDMTPVKRVYDATTPGLNDKALSKREKLLKTDSPAKWPTTAERRVKELENTVKQLRASNAKLRAERDDLQIQLESAEDEVEQAGCRKDDTQACNHHDVERIGNEIVCCDCGAKR